MDFKELVLRMMKEVYPDRIIPSRYDMWFEAMSKNGILGATPLERDIFNFSRKLLEEYDIVKKIQKVEWRLIETAPKDGTPLILSKWAGHTEHPTALLWITRGHWSTKWSNWSDGIEPCGLADPTHWMLQSELPRP